MRRRLGIRGQATVMIGITISSFVLLFAFAVNIGMLVNAKINLQNAADMAAYAGAAVQARHLNQISYLNYEMRRQYKKFLFRYYILGNMAQKSNPTGPASGARVWSPDGKPVNNFGVPAVCMVLSEKDNYCAQPRLPALKVPRSTTADVINDTLKKAILQIDSLKQGSCRAIGYKNFTTLSLWLFNTDPDVSALQRVLNDVSGAPADRDAANRIEIMKHVTSGLGLIPAEYLLRLRAETLASYINEAPKTGLGRGNLTAMEQSRDPARHERTIQAFYSAFNTLGENTFQDTSSITMDELLPRGNAGSNLIDLQQISVGFDAYAVQMGRTPNPSPSESEVRAACAFDGPPDNQQANNCLMCPEPITLPENSVPVGVFKNPSVLTHYAVKLEATAKVMFSPFGDVKLRAYSAAMPFGSRIGPPEPLVKDLFTVSASNTIFCDAGSGCIGKVPNLPIAPTESFNGPGWGWMRNDVQWAMYSSLAMDNSVEPQKQRITANTVARAYESAMAPQPYEPGKYNIPTFDAQTGDRTRCQPADPSLFTLCDSFSEHFDTSGTMAFWAPILPEDPSPTEVQARVKTLINSVSTAGSGGGAAKKVLTDEFKEALSKTLAEYITKIIDAPDPTTGEGFHIARIGDPMNHHSPGGARGTKEPIQFSVPGILVDANPSRPQTIKTSWNDVLDEEWRRLGRTGYSVKYVSFRTLTQPGAARADGVTGWTNTAGLSGEIGNDLPSLQH